MDAAASLLWIATPLKQRNRNRRRRVLHLREAASRARLVNNRGSIMKTTTILAIALGLGALGACHKNPQTQAADNYEANVDNSADTMVANVDNAADNMTAATDNAADAMKGAAKNKANAMKGAADNKADAMKNSD
jgi:hypothetical protein